MGRSRKPRSVRTLTLLSVFPLSLMLVAPTLARPRLVDTGNCFCACMTSGTGGIVGRSYPQMPGGGGCNFYDGKTCNFVDEAGLLKTGKLVGCEIEKKVEYTISKHKLELFRRQLQSIR